MSADLWLADIGIIEEESIPFFLSFLGPAEAARYHDFQRRERQRHFLLGRILLRLAVANFTGLRPAALNVIEHPGNAPSIDIPDIAFDSARSLPHFSISHSGRWAGCAVSADGPLGLDIETCSGRRRFDEIARMAFHADEYAWLQAQPESERQAAFYRIWTRKEALLKFLSMQGKLDKPISIGSLSENRVIDGTDAAWHFKNLICDDLSIAVCSASDNADIQLRVIERDDLTPFRS